MQEGTHPHAAELRARLGKYVEGKNFSFNSDTETVDSILNAMCMRFEKFGKDYCPCRRVTGDAGQDRQIECPCAFHEQELAEGGYCHCHLFAKTL